MEDEIKTSIWTFKSVRDELNAHFLKVNKVGTITGWKTDSLNFKVVVITFGNRKNVHN